VLGEFPSVQSEVLLKDLDGLTKAITESDHEVDVVDVLTAGEAVGEVVARIDDGLEVATVRADETKAAFDGLGVGRFVTQLLEGERHRQVVAQAA